MEQVMLGKRFTLTHKLGQGGFGAVYQALEVQTGRLYAAKLEATKANHQGRLEQEIQVLNALKGTEGVYQLHCFGQQQGFKWMIIDLLGCSVEALLHSEKKTFTEETVLMLGIQMLSRLDSLHCKGYVHRDIKPDNFVMGVNNTKNFLFLIDFGLAKMYIDPIARRQLPISSGHEFVGTNNFASIASHQGKQQFRKDDLESLGYVFVYLLKGSLPWSDISDRNKQLSSGQIYMCKKQTSAQSLCQGLSVQFREYMQYVRSLQVHSKPDYSSLKTEFKLLFRSKNYQEGFEWNQTTKSSLRDLFRGKDRFTDHRRYQH